LGNAEAGRVHARNAEAVGRPRLLLGERLAAEPVQRRSLEKRERLKVAALELFGEKGYERTSIREIARRARLAVGGFYQHFRTKRQLLLVLMDELLEGLSRLDLHPAAGGDLRGGIRGLLAAAFAQDLRYLGAYRAWQEAVLSDPGFARKQVEIHKWTTGRVARLLTLLQQAPGARHGVDIAGLAAAMDSFFWSLLGQAAGFPQAELNRQIDVATHLIYHATFADDVKTERKTIR
jgi:AcrR family transcriptional regulator